MSNILKIFSLTACLIGCLWVSASFSHAKGSSVFKITGKLNYKYNYSKEFNDLKPISNYKLLSDINKIAAFPVEQGKITQRSLRKRIKTKIKNDGSFVLELNTEKDWLLVFVHTDESGNESFFSQISIPVNMLPADMLNETLLLLPGTYAKSDIIDLGTIYYSGNFSLPDKGIQSADFSISLKQLDFIARNDNHLAEIRNLMNRPGGDSSTYYFFRTDYKWKGIYPELTGVYSDPGFYGYQGYNFQVDTNSTDVDINETCEVEGFTKKKIELFPPEGSEISDRYLSATYSETQPISNKLTVCTIASDGAVESQDKDFYATDRFGDILYILGRMLVTDPTPGGLWKLEIDGGIAGEFEPGISIPKTHKEKIDNIIAGIRVNKDDTGRITSIDVKWFEEDTDHESGYREITDPAILSLLVSSVNIYLENESGASRRYESIDLPEMTSSSVSPVNRWYFGYDGPVGEQAEAIGVSWRTGSIRQFVQFPRYVYPSEDAGCISPIPVLVRDSIDKGQQYNPTEDEDISRHFGIDFGFYLHDEDEGYELKDVVAPCDGVVTNILPFEIAGKYAVIIVIKHSETLNFVLCFEAQSSGEADMFNPEDSINAEQKKQIKVTVGQAVHQGDLIARLVVSLTEDEIRVLSEEGSRDLFGAHVHWAAFNTEPGTPLMRVAPDGPPLDWACPQNFMTEEEADNLNAIFGTLENNRRDGFLIPVCLD